MVREQQSLRIRFLSRNQHKIDEVQAILRSVNVEVIASNTAIEELQTTDTAKLVRDKCLRAFRQIGHALFVEHTGLYIKSLNGFPGGLTQIFWDTLDADRISAIFGKQPDPAVTARTVIGYCDGKRIHQFAGEVVGRIAEQPRGPRDFQWDCVFIPDGYEKTFAELGVVKNEISMRRRALDAFCKYLRGQQE